MNTPLNTVAHLDIASLETKLLRPLLALHTLPCKAPNAIVRSTPCVSELSRWWVILGLPFRSGISLASASCTHLWTRTRVLDIGTVIVLGYLFWYMVLNNTRASTLDPVVVNPRLNSLSRSIVFAESLDLHKARGPTWTCLTCFVLSRPGWPLPRGADELARTYRFPPVELLLMRRWILLYTVGVSRYLLMIRGSLFNSTNDELVPVVVKPPPWLIQATSVVRVCVD